MRVSHELLNSNRKNWAIFALAIVFFQLLVDVTIVLDVPVARQVLCGIYLTLVPGIILLTILGMRNLDSVEKFLFSIGLSVAFIMFLGLIMNQIGLSFELQNILSTPTLLLVMNSAVFFLCVLSFFLNKNTQWDGITVDISLPGVLTISLPLFAILGTTLVNFNGNSAILLLMIGIIALTVLTSSIRARTNWPLILFMMTIAVLLQWSLISNYIIGYDVHSSYHVLKITQSSGKWNSIINETDPMILRTNQMLSVTIFPAMYSNMLNLEGTWIFKIVYPLILALVPVGLYQLYQKFIEKKAAFIAAFVILAHMTFYQEMPGLPTQIISELFLVLLLIVMFHEKISPAKSMISFTIFSAGMIVSHYGISYIFMFLILFAWSISVLRKKQSKIAASYIALFFVMAFSWYIYTTRSASFTSLVGMVENIYRNFWTDLLDPRSRPEQALASIGAIPAVSIGHWLGRGFHYTIQFFIVLGVASIVLKRKVGYKFDHEYVAISSLMLTFAAVPLAAPSFNLLNETRIYHVSLLFLAPLCIVGGKSFFSFFPKLRKGALPFVLTLIIVTSLFLFDTGFIYEVTGDIPYSIPLSMPRMNREMVYGNGYVTLGVDVASAEWLHSNIVLTASTLVHADVVSVWFPLTSYAVFPRDHVEILSNGTVFDGRSAYVYLRNFNTFDGKILGPAYEFPSIHVWNTSDVSPRLEALNIIYSNGGSEIFFAINKTSP